MRIYRWAVLIILTISCACNAETARNIAKSAFKSVVLLEMNDSNGQPLSLGSGFFVADGVIATNAHVIEGASSGTAKLIGDSHKLKLLGIVAIDLHADLSLLRVDSAASALSVDATAKPVVGDPIYVVGNPLGLEGTFSEGIISGIRTLESGTILQMTAPISPGSSGGPVMDSSGAVIGVSVATFQNGQNLNLAIPASYLTRLISNPSNDLTPFSSRARRDPGAKSMIADLGTRVEAGLVISNFRMSNTGEYSFRISNKLPSPVSSTKVLIIYYDLTGAVMDFERFNYSESIPSGLTKTVTGGGCGYCESYRAASYYKNNRKDQGWEHWNDPIDPKVELRVIDFRVDESQQ